uniref:Alpha-type protein kinase domain-containing protein n=1 Tax=Hanusia phi TaxID=3032 RepID=A0A7S0HM43_9CRYP|mmetsp:Transcript_27574/g.62571  ORF Transcript_27574/g.62571 Transcript_27574/m.62571 type:complete len:265 (+) Transcript_27574:187-981(+)|eukprot:763912-Hanusia_phi.AAC.4
MRRIKSLEAFDKADATERPRGSENLRRQHSYPFESLELDGAERKSSWKELKALRFAFDKEDDCWVKDEMHIRIARRPFAEGSFRYCYDMQILHPDGRIEDMVAKRCKKEVDPSDYFNAVMNQLLANDFAQEFNSKVASSNMKFVPVYVYKILDGESKNKYFCVEPKLNGHYVKHNDNNGHVDTFCLLPQAFSHFTYEKSNRTMLVCDIQGVQQFLTDPQIHCASKQEGFFGRGNSGTTGISKFFETHVCNQICKNLGLKHPHEN